MRDLVATVLIIFLSFYYLFNKHLRLGPCVLTTAFMKCWPSTLSVLMV